MTKEDCTLDTQKLLQNAFTTLDSDPRRAACGQEQRESRKSKRLVEAQCDGALPVFS